MAIVPTWLNRIFAPAPAQIEQRATVTDSAWFQVLNGISGSGKVAAVTPRTAMSINAVYACVDLITRTKSSVRPKIYEINLNGKRAVLDHDQLGILTRQANSYTGAIQWEKIWVMSYYIWGNGYAEIKRNGRSGRPVEYINLEPWLVFPEWVNGEKVYIYHPDGNGSEKAGQRVIKSRDMLHLADLSWNNLEGSSRISNNVGVINEYQNIANYGKQMYENGAQISGLVIANKPTSNESLELLRKSLDRFKNKNGEAWSVPFGFEYKPMTFNMPMADAQLIEAKKMSIEDIARAFGVPLTLVQRGESADNKGDNEYNTFLGNVIMPLCLLMEEEFNRKIFRAKEVGYYVRYDLKDLYRWDIRAKAESDRIALESGYKNIDEVRNDNDLDPLPNGLGQVFRVPMNFMPLNNFLDYEPGKKGKKDKEDKEDKEDGNT